jgi:hypothetical protein
MRLEVASQCTPGYPQTPQFPVTPRFHVKHSGNHGVTVHRLHLRTWTCVDLRITRPTSLVASVHADTAAYRLLSASVHQRRLYAGLKSPKSERNDARQEPRFGELSTVVGAQILPQGSRPFLVQNGTPAHPLAQRSSFLHQISTDANDREKQRGRAFSRATSER